MTQDTIAIRLPSRFIIAAGSSTGRQALGAGISFFAACLLPPRTGADPGF